VSELDLWINAYLNSYRKGADSKTLETIDNRIDYIINTRGG